MTLRNRTGETATVDELQAIENIADTAFWQLMLVEDLDHGFELVELLVLELRSRFGAIVEAATSQDLAGVLT